MFLSWEGFCNRLIQMYNNPKVTITAKCKLQELTQQKLIMDYTTQFQTYATQTEQNNKTLIVQYKQELKAKIQNAIILIKDPNNIRELIK